MAVYGVGTRNLFDLLDEDADQTSRRPKAKAAAPAAAPAAAARRAQAAPVAPIPGQFDKPNNRSNTARAPRTERDSRDRGQRSTRGGRVFERHSGTGRDRSTRKGGYGGYAAEGTVKDDLVGQTGKADPNAVAASTAAPADAAATTAVAEVKAAEPPAPQYLSLSQHEEELKKKAVAEDAKKQVRQVTDDVKGFKKGTVKTKAEATADDFFGLGEQKKQQKAKETKSKSKTVLNFEEFAQQVADVAPAQEAAAAQQAAAANETGFVEAQQGRARGAPRGGRGGRGAARGGRGAARTSAPRGARLDLKDDSAFPTLGSR